MSVHSAIVFLCFIGIHLHHFPGHYKRYSLEVKEDQQKLVIHFAHQALWSHNDSMLNSTNIPKILIWTPSISIRNISDDSLIRILRNLGQSCPFKCEIESRKRIHENDAAAIVFHSRTMTSTDLPKERREDQIYVFLCHEAQPRCGEEDKKLIPTFFNTSMTTLRDEIAYNFGYGEVVRTNNDDLLKKISNEMWFRIFSNKKKLGLAIISNCYTPSKREYYLKELSLHVKLSLLGSCFGSHRICSNTEQNQHCMAELLESHFFYFAFENSVCKDYITEKLFDRLQKNIVPVVLRRRILEGVVPSSAFIAADDFASPKDLAEYLIRVSKDEKLYRRYFEWRNTHAVSSFITMRGNGICALCSDLWRKIPRTSSNYVARDHYSATFCEPDVGCKLIGKHCKSERNPRLQESRAFFKGL